MPSKDFSWTPAQYEEAYEDDSSSDELFPRSTKKRQSFSTEEDKKLTDLVRKCGEKNWNYIASKLPGRTARQVRERWVNYLSPNVSHEPFSAEEDAKLESLMAQFGTKWSKIAEHFPNRTDVLLKNHAALIKRQIKKGKRVSSLARTDSLKIDTESVMAIKKDERSIPNDVESIFDRIPSPTIDTFLGGQLIYQQTSQSMVSTPIADAAQEEDAFASFDFTFEDYWADQEEELIPHVDIF